MAVSLEPLVSIAQREHVWLARFGDKHKIWGDPYTGTLVVVREADSAHLIAHAGRRISHGERRELAAMLQQQGMAQVRWERRHRGYSAEHRL